MLRLAQLIRRSHDEWRRGFRRYSGGQIAVIFIVLMALLLILAASTMNLGEVARLKTATANAADAGSLAGASWVASGTNDLALIAQAQWLNWWLVQIFFTAPWCIWLMWAPPLIVTLLMLINWGIFKEQVADPMIKAAWENAQAAALFTAIQNLLIDDRSGQSASRIQQLARQFEQSRNLPPVVVLNWMREGADGQQRPSQATVRVEFLNGRPELTMGGWSPIAWGFIPCCISPPTACFPAFGWNFWAPTSVPGTTNWLARLFPGPMGASWLSLMAFIPIPSFGPCGYLACYIPFFTTIPAPNPVQPDNITESTGRVVVEVTQRRGAGSDLAGFWRMRYPDEFLSRSTAEYSGADVCGPFSACDDATANLVEVN